jgi:hypothetical protein
MSGVKCFLSVLLLALRRAHHFALVEDVRIQPRLARNPFQVGNSVRPMHLFGHSVDHDYYFELPREEGAGYPINYSMFDFTHRDIRVVPRANRTFSAARNPIPCASSSKGEPPVFAPWPPWRFSVPAASSGGHTCCAIPGGCAPLLAPLPPTGNAAKRND